VAQTYDDIFKAVVAMKPTRAPILKRWDFYRGDVDRPPYFPRLTDETDDHYRDRLKIVVGWCGSMANRIAGYFRKEPIKFAFTVDGDEDNALAKEAGKLWEAIADYNGYESFMIDLSRDAGVGGNGYAKERFVFFDSETGEKFQTGDMKGRVLIDRVNEAFVYRVPIGNVQAFVEAWMIRDGQVSLLEEYDTGGQERVEYVCLIAPPWFDPIAGELKAKSTHTVWQNKALTYGPLEIPHMIPMQRFANLVSRPASENGISDIQWLIPLNHMINHIFTGAARAVQYHGEPKPVFEGVEDDGGIKWATDSAIFLPTNASGVQPKASFLTWDQNIAGAKAIYTDAGEMMSSIGGVPKHMLGDLGAAGSVVSGVALRIMYESLNQVCKIKEAGFKPAEEKTIKTCLSMLAYYNNKPGHFDAVQVQVQYNPDRTPRDNDLEFQADQKKVLANFWNLIDLVMKYEPDIETREQAIELLQKKAAEKKLLQGMGLISAPPTFAWQGDEKPGEGSDRKPSDKEPQPNEQKPGQKAPEDEGLGK
jgi:hypothetical protein